MSNQDGSNTTKKSTVYVALITAIAIIIGSVILGLGGQTTPQEPTPEAAPAVELPSAGITESNKASITFSTNQGEIVIETTPSLAPLTVNAIAALAQKNYFDKTICHRLTTEGIYVLQCGDPTGTGTGGPGFNIPDENLPQPTENNYPAGTVAMANAGPGTSGSQFFLVYQDTTLGPDYTIWGSITSGLDILQTIASAGVVDGGTDGAPVSGVTIESTKVTIS
ncbi:MAG: peptidylprolyl isomerase [Actinobacteria bacterium]|nr:peptidylprolyl isomerase [Actinomycetota bacterium]